MYQSAHRLGSMWLWCLLAISFMTNSATLLDEGNGADPDEISQDLRLTTAIPESFPMDNDDNVSVRLVHVLFRHGDRSPTKAYKNDLYTEDDWPQGFGQLSTLGMKQEWELGKFIREVYVNNMEFLSKNYSRTEVYARSTTRDRALMSAYSFLAGLYPTNGGNWSLDITWQPIPVHTQVNESDFLLYTDVPCPVAEAAWQQFLKTDPNIQELIKQYGDFFEFVSKNSGEPNNWQGVQQVVDPIYCQYVSGYRLPDWVTDVVRDKLIDLKDVFCSIPRPQVQLKLRGGTLLKEMIDHMINKSIQDESVSDKKLFVYSAHDSTILMFLGLLGVFNGRQPPYSACVIVELLQSKTTEHDFYVRLWYRNETNSQPYLLTIEHCDNLEKCPLERFIGLYKDLLPVDIKRECGLENTNSKNEDGGVAQEEFSKASTILNVILVLVLLLTVVGMVVGMLCRRDKTRDSHDYSPVPTEMADIS